MLQDVSGLSRDIREKVLNLVHDKQALTRLLVIAAPLDQFQWSPVGKARISPAQRNTAKNVESKHALYGMSQS